MRHPSELFGQRLVLPDLGDLVVGRESALAGAAVPELGGGPVEIGCEGLVLFVTPLPDCEHRNQTSSLEVAKEVLFGIDTYLGAEVDPYNATYSVTCAEESTHPFSV